MSSKKVLDQFIRNGYNQNSSLSLDQLQRVLDKMAKANSTLPGFDSSVLEELWEETPKAKDKVVVYEFVETIVRAQDILRDNLYKFEMELGQPAEDEQEREEQKANFAQFTYDLSQVTAPFGMTDNRKLNAGAPNELENSMASGRSSGLFDHVPSARPSSKTMKLAIILTIIGLLFEVILMFQKDHFLNLLVLIGTLSIVLLGFFDRYYVRMILISLLVSSLLDFIWLFVMADPFWNPTVEAIRSTQQTVFLRFIYFFVIIVMVIKLFIMILLFRFKDNDAPVRKNITLFGTNFEIDGLFKRAESPMSAILAPTIAGA